MEASKETAKSVDLQLVLQKAETLQKGRRVYIETEQDFDDETLREFENRVFLYYGIKVEIKQVEGDITGVEISRVE